jgi:hypothetical protein
MPCPELTLPCPVFRLIANLHRRGRIRFARGRRLVASPTLYCTVLHCTAHLLMYRPTFGSLGRGVTASYRAGNPCPVGSNHPMYSNHCSLLLVLILLLLPHPSSTYVSTRIAITSSQLKPTLPPTMHKSLLWRHSRERYNIFEVSRYKFYPAPTSHAPARVCECGPWRCGPCGYGFGI